MVCSKWIPPLITFLKNLKNFSVRHLFITSGGKKTGIGYQFQISILTHT